MVNVWGRVYLLLQKTATAILAPAMPQDLMDLGNTLVKKFKNVDKA